MLYLIKVNPISFSAVCRRLSARFCMADLENKVDEWIIGLRRQNGE